MVCVSTLWRGDQAAMLSSHREACHVETSCCGKSDNSYLPDGGLHWDLPASGPWVRVCHCTSTSLTPAITSNAGNSAV